MDHCPHCAAFSTIQCIFFQVERLERRESTVSTSESESASSSEFDADAVVQEASPELAERKPKLKGRALTVLPAQNKDSEMSGLCAIM